jgi:hypothetical protein
MPPHETLAVTSSRPNSKALAACVVLSHPHVAFYPYTCGLCEGATMVAAALIGYDDMEVAAGTTTRRRRSWMTTYSTPTRDYIGLLLQRFFCCSALLVVTIHDLLLASILRWHGRSSANVAYSFPNTYIQLKVLLRCKYIHNEMPESFLCIWLFFHVLFSVTKCIPGRRIWTCWCHYL